MDKEEITMIGFEIVANAGEAKSKLLNAVNCAKDGEYSAAKKLIAEADSKLDEAHNTQTKMLTKVARGEDINVNLILMHGQDHLMTAILLKDLSKHLVDLYEKSN